MIASLVEDIDSRCEIKVEVYERLTIKECYDVKCLARRVEGVIGELGLNEKWF